jgi:hypothetical protein
LAARREGAARDRSLMREWAPAILATFFTVDGRSAADPAREPTRGGRPSARGRRC